MFGQFPHIPAMRSYKWGRVGLTGAATTTLIEFANGSRTILLNKDNMSVHCIAAFGLQIPACTPQPLKLFEGFLIR